MDNKMTNTPKNLNVSLYKDDQLQNTKYRSLRNGRKNPLSKF